ncbi:MAG: hypothetical protein AB1705_15985 [Verrucomicrobiota bacterium]
MLMKALLICPAERDSVAALSENCPLSNLPVFGKSLIAWWLEHLAGQGVKEATILATDRPEQVRELIGDGARWGLKADVFPETHELTCDEARAKYCSGPGWLCQPDDVRVIDHLPGHPEHALFDSCRGWFAAIQAWFPGPAPEGRIGVREIKPGVWAGMGTRVAPQAELRAPCWLGEQVCVGPGAVIGPMAVLEDRVFVEGAAEISRSIIGPETLVGELTEIRDSIANGNTLVSWKLDSCIKVPDAFLLCAMSQRRAALRPMALASRLCAALVMALTLPVGLAVILWSALHGQRAFRPRLATRPRASRVASMPNETFIYYELTGASGWLSRWPQLWSIVRGDFAWIGNRPLSPDQAFWLANDFERLWLAAPVGLISLADAEACGELLSDEGRAHASFYAARANWQMDLAIFARALFRLVAGIPYSRVRGAIVHLARSHGIEERKAH